MARRNDQFQTIRTEGAILPPDILRRIASLTVAGAAPDAYHLPPGSKPSEAIAQSWTSLLNHWRAFRDARERIPTSDETGTAVTNERWLLPLFNELDYGRLVTSKAPVIDERVYPIERFYNHTPIHLIGCKLPLDRRTRGARGAATATPHSMVQEFLNRSDQHVWAFLSNGRQLRVLRDNVSLSRQTFVEFDLEAMMEGEVYADFALLWLLCHQSRVEAEKPEDCWLEKWSKLARDQGTRVLNHLRLGVGKSIEALGRGFIGHPRNDRLREKLQAGTLSKDDFYRQLLRIVYRLLFLFVAEDRDLLHPPDAASEACDLYDTHYSTRRLRELALNMRGSKHSDLWHSLSLVFAALGKHEGCPQLGLCGLGSFLWRSSSTADLLGPHQANGESAFITNDDLLLAVRELAYVEQDRSLRVVDYRNLGSEELGSVYESLLELHPVMNVQSQSFELMTAAGNERKTTGSYYTPDSLVQCLLDSALDPVVKDRLTGKKGEEAEKAILDLKLCDPACGSGHFLIAAAHRLARHLARIRTGESEPSPEDYQHALRDVIGRCVYGVDLNPMAVELCKVSLWMEAIEPGKPLSFLDHHIQCGNSLLGTTPTLLARGIPDDAYRPIEGDDKAICSELKRDNKKQRQEYETGQGHLFAPPIKLGNLPAVISELNLADDDSLAHVETKRDMYERAVRGADYLNARLLADTWCAAFVWKKEKTDLGKHCPTERDFRAIENNPHSILPHVKAEVRRLAEQYQFFHWHLAFPDVFLLPGKSETPENEQTGWSGGFDVVLGNPPWEMVEVSEKEFFSAIRPDISSALTARDRTVLISALSDSDPLLFEEFQARKREVAGLRHFIQDSSRMPASSVGRINSYPLFVEVASHSLATHGRVGLIVPSAVAMDAYNAQLFRWLCDTRRIVSLFDFENRDAIFPGVHRSYRFCLLTLSGPTGTEDLHLCFFAHDTSELRDPSRQFAIKTSDLVRFSPNTLAPPMLLNAKDGQLAARTYRRNGVLFDRRDSAAEERWPIAINRMLSLSDKGDIFRHSSELEGSDNAAGADHWERLYTGKSIHQYNHRYAGWAGDGWKASDESQLRRSQFEVATEYYARKHEVTSRTQGKVPSTWLLGYRDVCRATDERTAIAAVIPLVGCDTHCRNIYFDAFRIEHAVCLLANFNSFVLDYFCRQKVVSIGLGSGIVEQLPFLQRCTVEWDSAFLGMRVGSWVLSRVVELTYTAWDLEAFALDCGYDGPPLRWDEERRFFLRCELDAAYFHLYLGPPEEWGADSPELAEMFPASRDAVEYIMDTFPIVKRKDIARTQVKNEAGQIIQEGRYITKDTILEIYDEMADAIRTGRRYQTRLKPAPGPPADAEECFIPMAQWDPGNWPPHIHAPTSLRVEEPQELSVAAFAAMAYPSTESHRVTCGAALALVEQAGELPSMQHLDGLLLATHPNWCRAFLDEADQGAFDAALRAAPAALFVGDGESIHWKQCRDYLERLSGLAIDRRSSEQVISLGAAVASAKARFPEAAEAIVSFAVKALSRVQKLRDDLAAASEAQRQILRVFDDQHQLYELAA